MKGKKGLPKGNDVFHKGGFRLYQPDKSAGRDETQNKGKGKDQQGKGKEGTYPQSGLSASETPNEEGYDHAWESVICLPAIGLTIFGLQMLGGSNTRGSGPWLHTVDWTESGKRNILEACMVLWHNYGILPLSWTFRVRQLRDRNLRGKLHCPLSNNSPCSTKVDVTGDVPILFSLSQTKRWV